MVLPASNLVLNKGRWYVQITIPQELRDSFKGRKQLKVSTGTSDPKLAKLMQHEKTTELHNKLRAVQNNEEVQIYEELREIMAPISAIYDDRNPKNFTKDDWEKLKALVIAAEHPADLGDPELEAHFVEQGGKARAKYDKLAELTSTSMPFIQWVETWLQTDPFTREKTKAEAKKAVEEFNEFSDNPRLNQITKPMAYKWAEHLGETKASKTIRKRLSYVSQALSYAEQMGEIETNPLHGLKLSKYGKKAEAYQPFTDAELHSLLGLNDVSEQVRLLIRVLATSGMRLDEAALLNFEDVKEENGVLFYDLTTKSKLVKNIGSARKVPVHDSVHIGGGEGPIFTEFSRDNDGKAQSHASKVLMKAVRRVTSDPHKVIHSLRGTFKDKLRDAGVSKEINDFITGHGSGDVAGTYGQGPSLAQRKEAIDKIDL